MRNVALRLGLGLVVFVLVGWALGELWTSIVGSRELAEMRTVVEARSAGLTTAARVVTWAGTSFVLVPLALITCLMLVRAGLRDAGIAVIVSLAGAMLISASIKLLVSRPRPSVEHLQAVGGSSFPSGHATQASAFWFSLVLVLNAVGAPPRVLRTVAAIALAIVLAVAASRVYLGVHYPSDVVAGVLIGTGWTVFVSRTIGVRAVG